jgi:hypothetical protein
LISFAQAILASERVLSCHSLNTQDSPRVLKIDLDNKTVRGSLGLPEEAPVPIQVTDDNISWTLSGFASITLSRVTGHLMWIGIGTAAGARIEFQCEVVTANKF